MKSEAEGFIGFRPNTREELFAMELAMRLSDTKSLALYISFAKKYDEATLRRFLGVVMEIPANKIKKSRGALFNYLIQKYAEETETKDNPRD